MTALPKQRIFSDMQFLLAAITITAIVLLIEGALTLFIGALAKKPNDKAMKRARRAPPSSHN